MIGDFAIIGGGAAGCLLASRLCRLLPDAAVILIEAGRAKPGLFNRVPLLSGFAPLKPTTNWRHPAFGPAGDQSLSQGKMLGGSSFINGMVISLGTAADYASWEAEAGPDWSWEACKAGFDALLGGEMPQSPCRPSSPLVEGFLQSAAAAGMPIVPDLNAASGERAGLTAFNTAGGLRRTSADLLRPRPKNLTILTGAEAQELLSQNGRITGVRLQDGRQITARSEVILAAGAVQSAALLLRSGIGPAAMLEASDVPVLCDLPELGQNLQNHPSYALKLPVSGESLSALLSPLTGARAGARYLLRRQGPLAQGIFQAAAYFSPEPGGPADAQAIFAPVMMPPPGAGWLGSLPRQHGISLAVQQGQPFSRGEVTLAAGRLRIDTGAFRDPRDGAFLSRAISRMQQVLRQGPLRQMLRSEAGLEPVSPEQVAQASGTAFHMAGTARMGRDARAVTAPDLRLNGLEGLSLADASVMPLIPNAALHFPSMMIAWRAAEFIRRRHSAGISKSSSTGSDTGSEREP